MFGPIFASPSFAELREQPKIATPAPTLHRGSSGRSGGLGIILHLGCIALAGVLTVCVFFGLAFYFLAHPIDEVMATSSARHRWGEASLPMVVPAAAPVVRVGGAPAPQPMRAGPTGQPERAAALVATVAARSRTPQPRTVEATQTPQSKRLENASAEIVSGPVTEALDAMTWVVGGQIVRLWGIRPGPQSRSLALAAFVGRVSAEGPINCRRQALSTRYRCLTATREDIAEMALLSGIGRAAEGATGAYRSAEAQARARGEGLWAKP